MTLYRHKPLMDSKSTETPGKLEKNFTRCCLILALILAILAFGAEGVKQGKLLGIKYCIEQPENCKDDYQSFKLKYPTFFDKK